MSGTFPHTLVDGAAQEIARVFLVKISFGRKENEFVLVQKAVLGEGGIWQKGEK